MHIAKATLADPASNFANIAFLTDNNRKAIPCLVKAILLHPDLVGGATLIPSVQLCLMPVNLILSIWYPIHNKDAICKIIIN